MISLTDYAIWFLITLAGTWLIFDAIRDLVCDRHKAWYNLGFIFICLVQLHFGVLAFIGSYGYATKIMEGLCHTVN